MNEISSDFFLIEAEKIGFDLYGITEAVIPPDDRKNIESWVDQKLFGVMNWYPDRQEIRLDFKNLGFTPKSILVLGVLYNPFNYKSYMEKFNFKFSKYAIGEDYHKVLRRMGKKLIQIFQDKHPQAKFRQGVDSLPLPEKILGRESGLGWIGKNTCLIHPQKGSFFFLSVILTDLEIHHTKEITPDRCGTCNECIDACPTGAIFEPYKINAGLCISHNTIENKEPIKSSNYHWLYGCDICQDVCPWNEKAIRKEMFTGKEEFSVSKIFEKSEEEILNLPEFEFNEWKKNTALNRISYEKFQDNVNNYRNE
ncbi:MAG: tRNA epoxyqueuosine(34) reductase QueG [Leptospiraceae bacterium]|nr:tRNA epoxyqueuosine(34) reductase QueG [Leptospiraceae bacterium]MCP5511644.1 tRNA epoxyqueuosine(34) reductase QueG [Leptospiraceae bacterium]